MAPRDKRPTLESLFELPDDYLHKPIPALLRPALIDGTDRASGHDRLLKIWLKTQTPADDELRELWLHERLQVDRIMSYPGADEVMAGVLDMIETSDAFCVIHEAEAVPLAAKLRTAPARHWLRSLNAPANRIILWQNFCRLAKALGIIHVQGLIHGRIDTFAVFTEGRSSPDFRLGGFEWSLSLAEPRPLKPSMQQVRTRIERLIYSYAEDWKALASLFAGLLGLNPNQLREDDPFDKNAAPIELEEEEIDVLRRLIDPDNDEQPEARLIIRDVDELARNLGQLAKAHSSRLTLLLRPNQKMADAIYTATEGAVLADDREGQISFVEADLASGARLVEPEQAGEPDCLFIVTELMSYLLCPYSENGSPTWDIAVVTSIVPRTDARLPSNRDVHAIRHQIDLVSSVRTLGPQSRVDSPDWVQLIAGPSASPEDAETQTLRQAVLLLQAIDALLKMLELLPVEVVAVRKNNGRPILQIAPRPYPVRDIIAAEIGERSTSDVLDRLFDKDDLGIDVEWRLSTSGTLGPRGASDTPVRFLTVTRADNGQAVYEFAAEDVPQHDALFLRRQADHGTESLIKRRLRTTQVLGDQRDLVAMFADPRRRLRASGDALEHDEHFDRLDEPKQRALEAIWTTKPTHLVVGPPGVGKTWLVSELVRRKLAAEPAARMLISAQSHHALDHILGETRKIVQKFSSDAIIVRSPGNDDTISTDADVRRTSLQYLQRTLQSPILNDAPTFFRQSIDSLKNVYERLESEERPSNRREAEGIRALNALVLESANLVFSTATSQDIERLIEDGAQFDWAIIEEAAKASGPDLIAPLSLSGRRLLIGDHNQLAPFDAERIANVLANRTAVFNALTQAEGVIASTFFDSGLDDLRRALEDDGILLRVCSAARRMLEPFRHLVQEDEARRPVSGGRRHSVSSELLVQHRMDPAIAELISRCFYQGRLDTGEERRTAAAKPLPFSFGPLIPPSPIIFIDTPYVSRTGRAKPMELDRPRWHNPTEVRVVGQLLSLLSPTSDFDGNRSTVAVLSPYRAQVDRIVRQVQTVQASDNTKLNLFDGFAHDGRIWGTVDSSQGSEADLVIVSLVRNNHRTGPSALGFLRDPRRMNVLLSRAKKQLVLVGSLEFLRESARHATTSPDDELAFVRLFLDSITAMQKQQSISGAPKVSIVKAESLRSAA